MYDDLTAIGVPTILILDAAVGYVKTWDTNFQFQFVDDNQLYSVFNIYL